MFKAFPKVQFLWGVPGLQWPLFMRSCPRKEQRPSGVGPLGDLMSCHHGVDFLIQVELNKMCPRRPHLTPESTKKDLLLTSRCSIPQHSLWSLVEAMPRRVRTVSATIGCTEEKAKQKKQF